MDVEASKAARKAIRRGSQGLPAYHEASIFLRYEGCPDASPGPASFRRAHDPAALRHYLHSVLRAVELDGISVAPLLSHAMDAP